MLDRFYFALRGGEEVVCVFLHAARAPLMDVRVLHGQQAAGKLPIMGTPVSRPAGFSATARA